MRLPEASEADKSESRRKPRAPPCDAQDLALLCIAYQHGAPLKVTSPRWFSRSVVKPSPGIACVRGRDRCDARSEIGSWILGSVTAGNLSHDFAFVRYGNNRGLAGCTAARLEPRSPDRFRHHRRCLPRRTLH